MKKVYYLSSCSTCQRILRELQPGHKGFVLQDIAQEKITGRQLDEMKERAGSYEAVFSRRAIKYRALGLHQVKLDERDYRRWILQEYTFLKRPVFIVDDGIFAGSEKKTIDELKRRLA